MMKTTMDVRFDEADYEPVEVDGELVHPFYRTSLSEGDVVRIEWLSAASPRIQGLSLRLRHPEVRGKPGYGGLLRVEHAESPAIALWMDSAHAVVTARCVRLEPGAQLEISNTWRMPDGREDEWFLNYGMKIERVGDRAVVLHCSDGIGNELTFDDQVVRVQVERPANGT
jgi:hypothetical protein